jgi:hypothetical protein
MTNYKLNEEIYPYVTVYWYVERDIPPIPYEIGIDSEKIEREIAQMQLEKADQYFLEEYLRGLFTVNEAKALENYLYWKERMFTEIEIVELPISVYPDSPQRLLDEILTTITLDSIGLDITDLDFPCDSPYVIKGSVVEDDSRMWQLIETIQGV